MIEIIENEKSIASKRTYPRLMMLVDQGYFVIALTKDDIFYLRDGVRSILKISNFTDYNGKLTLENGD